MSEEELSPDVLGDNLDKESSGVDFTKEQKNLIITHIQTSETNLEHRKAIFSSLLVLSLVSFVMFLAYVFQISDLYIHYIKDIISTKSYSLECKLHFDYYFLIPICLCGVLPTVFIVALLRGLYPREQKKESNPFFDSCPTGLIKNFGQDASE